MKKPKRPGSYEHRPNPARDTDLESPDRYDDVIELEDIIEMPDSPIDEENDLDLDDDFFDSDTDLPRPRQEGVQPVAADHPHANASQREEDLFESLGDEPEEEDTLFGAPASGRAEKGPGPKRESQLLDIDDESLFDELLDEPGKPAPDEQPNLGAGTAAASKTAEKVRPAEEEIESPIFDEPSASAQPLTAAPTSVSQAEILETAEELIGRIEFRLREHIRATVDSMLPDLVRSIIQEEIEKLKKELL